jgi:hypothetical protein
VRSAILSADLVTSADVSAIVSTVAAQALSDYDAPTAAEITTLSANLHLNIGSVSAAISARVVQAITDALPLAANVVQYRGSSARGVVQEAILQAVIKSSTQAGTLSRTQAFTLLASTTADTYKGRLITFLSGNAIREQLEISAASASSGGMVLTFTTAAHSVSAGLDFIVT